MNLICKMYQGDYVLQEGKIGHEFINFIKADDGNFYIWLNANGTYSNKAHNNINILMIRTIAKGIYAVLGKAVNCSLVDGADSSQFKSPNERFSNQQNISYKHKNLSEIYANERNVLVTFRTTQVYRPIREIFVTNNADIEVDNETIFRLNIRMKTSMRQYVGNDDEEFNNLIEKADLWERNVSNDTIDSFIEQYTYLFDSISETMYTILGRERDENSISNSIYYFLKKYDLIADFLNNLDDSIDKNQVFKIYREKDKIDLLFIGEKDIVVIENKINSQINGISDSSYDGQIDSVLKASDIKDFINESQINEEDIKKDLIKFANGSTGRISQLSKYFVIANIIAKCKGMLNINVRFFLLIPKYSDVFYKENEKGYITKCYGTKLLLSDKYKKITYDKICSYFSMKNIGNDQYFTDFLKTINKLTNKTDCLYESKIAKALNAIYNPSNENCSNQ